MQFDTTNKELPEEEQASEAKFQQMVINETAKAFFNAWENSVRTQQQYMRQNLFIGDMKPLTFIKQLKRMNKFLNYFPREKVFDVNLIEIDEQQLISLMYHASHGIMQLQIQQAGKSINDFQSLDTLKVFFSQQHDCAKLEERIMKVDDKALEEKSKNKNKNKKRKAKNANDEAESSKNIRTPSDPVSTWVPGNSDFKFKFFQIRACISLLHPVTKFLHSIYFL
jgi:hypothetical protein